MTTFVRHESLNVFSNFPRDSVKEATATEEREEKTVIQEGEQNDGEGYIVSQPQSFQKVLLTSVPVSPDL